MKPLLDILIPTFNNVDQLLSCLRSIQLATFGPSRSLIRFIVVNNGHEDLKNYLVESDRLVLLYPGKNLGWEGGLKLGLTKSDAPLVAFSNDDIRFVEGDKFWLWKMASVFNDPSVGAVGPSSNFVMGQQSIFADIEPIGIQVKYLIGFFMMLRRSDLDKAGSVDDTLPGGDDIDLSIRLRNIDKKLICRRDVFVYHHGSQTGGRVQAGYWNSPQMQERTNLALIKKHGMFKFWDTIVASYGNIKEYGEGFAHEDIEGNICRKYAEGFEKILELGCGAVKTVPGSVAVDLRKHGEKIEFIAQDKNKSVADIVADVSSSIPIEDKSQDCIISRHILEHCQDTVNTLRLWNGKLKIGGRLIIAVPNAELGNVIVLNPEHCHAFTPSSLQNVSEVCGLRLDVCYPNINGMSLVSVFEKVSDAAEPERDRKREVTPLASRLEAVA